MGITESSVLERLTHTNGSTSLCVFASLKTIRTHSQVRKDATVGIVASVSERYGLSPQEGARWTCDVLRGLTAQGGW